MSPASLRQYRFFSQKANKNKNNLELHWIGIHRIMAVCICDCYIYKIRNHYTNIYDMCIYILFVLQMYRNNCTKYANNRSIQDMDKRTNNQILCTYFEWYSICEYLFNFYFSFFSAIAQNSRKKRKVRIKLARRRRALYKFYSFYNFSAIEEYCVKLRKIAEIIKVRIKLARFIQILFIL